MLFRPGLPCWLIVTLVGLLFGAPAAHGGSAEIFADGFESGTVCAWSSALGIDTGSCIPGPLADLRVLLTDSPDPVAIGQVLTYTIRIDNLGPNAASGVWMLDILPFELTMLSITTPQGTCTESFGEVSCELGFMSAGQRLDLTLRTLVGASAFFAVTNAAGVVSETPDPQPGNDIATAVTRILE